MATAKRSLVIEIWSFYSANRSVRYPTAYPRCGFQIAWDSCARHFDYRNVDFAAPHILARYFIHIQYYDRVDRDYDRHSYRQAT